MKRTTTLCLNLAMIMVYACTPTKDDHAMEKWKQEIVETEKQFAAMAVDKGIAEAFLTFAADDAVLMRSRKVIVGKDAIRARFENSDPQPDRKLEWEPEFVDVSASGDLGYTYGPYTLTTYDSLGNESKISGIFHTVWKRQSDGTWKFVWD